MNSGLRRPPGRQVGGADVADLAVADQVVEGAQRLVDRRAPVELVELVEIDPVSAEAFERVLDRLHDVAARGADLHARIVHGHAELAGEHDVLAPRAERLAEEPLRSAAPAIHIGRVEQRDAGVERGRDHIGRLGGVEAHAEIVAA